jgi:8-oxo-dGTP pyrophosphatase MutT (NUDIX family)
MKDRAAIILFDDRLGALLMHRRKAGAEYCALIGGKVEDDETPIEACIREVKEESGLDVRIERQVAVLENAGRIEHYFLAGSYRGTPQLGGPELARQSDENHYELRWVPLERLADLELMPPAIRPVVVELARKWASRAKG